MSKHNDNVAETQAEHERLRRVNKIPDMENLFRQAGEDGGEKAGNGFIWKLLKRDWKAIVASLLFVLQSAPMWMLPVIISDVVDLITYRPDNFVMRMVIDAVIMFVLLLQNVPTTMWRSSIMNKATRRTTAQVKSAVVRKLQRLSITYHKEIEEGRIQSKLLRDIDGIELYYRTLLNGFIPNLISALVSIIIAIVKSPIVMLFFVAVVPINVVCVRCFRKPINKDSYLFRKENEKLSSKLTTTLQMMTLTKAHGLAATEENAVGQKIDSVTKAGLKLDRTQAQFFSMMWVANQFLAVVCLFFCVTLAVKGWITTGEVLLFQSLFSTITNSVLALLNVYPTMVTGAESVRSLSEIMCAGDIERDVGSLSITKIYGNVDFDSVCYRYPGEEKDVISDFQLHVKKGERIALVGASGSGKSTIMNLIIGLLSPTQGRIYIDGQPLDEIPMQEYRHFISVVPQNSILFSGTIRENITYGLEHYSEAELQKAVCDANIDEFLCLLPNGLDSQVGEHGDKLSGGQKQRISIARALIRNPKILILDEATSALDNLSEYHVQKAIDRLVEERTTFIVAHRLSTIRNADRIVVMEEGKMVEVGTYTELMALGGRFCELERLSRIREEQIRRELE